jgi:hypothetical protein
VDLVVPGTFEAQNRNCSHLVKAGNNDVIIVDPPNWSQKLTSPHTFQHVTKNAKSKKQWASATDMGDTPADHDFVDFRNGDSHSYSQTLQRAFASLYICVRSCNPIPGHA